MQFNETYILASQFLKTLHLVSCVSVSCLIEAAAVVWEIFCLWKHLRYKFQSQFFRFLQSLPIYISRHTKFTKAHHRLRIYSSKAGVEREGGRGCCVLSKHRIFCVEISNKTPPKVQGSRKESKAQTIVLWVIRNWGKSCHL